MSRSSNRTPLRGPTSDAASRSRADGWYLWDYDRCEVVRGPFKTDEAAGAVRREVEGDRNLWIADAETIDHWEAELGR